MEVYTFGSKITCYHALPAIATPALAPSTRHTLATLLGKPSVRRHELAQKSSLLNNAESTQSCFCPIHNKMTLLMPATGVHR
eukprot:3095156-Amphidinium_carterae.1